MQFTFTKVNGNNANLTITGQNNMMFDMMNDFTNAAFGDGIATLGMKSATSGQPLSGRFNIAYQTVMASNPPPSTPALDPPAITAVLNALVDAGPFQRQVTGTAGQSAIFVIAYDNSQNADINLIVNNPSNTPLTITTATDGSTVRKFFTGPLT